MHTGSYRLSERAAWPPICGFFPTTGAQKTPARGAGAHSSEPPTAPWTSMGPPGSHSAEPLARAMYVRRLAALNPLLWTFNHPSSSFLWAGNHLPLASAKLGSVHLCPPNAPQAPSPQLLVPGNLHRWRVGSRILCTKMSSPEPTHFCLPAPLDTPGCWSPSSLVMCLFIVERKQNHSHCIHLSGFVTSPHIAVG